MKHPALASSSPIRNVPESRRWLARTHSLALAQALVDLPLEVPRHVAAIFLLQVLPPPVLTRHHSQVHDARIAAALCLHHGVAALWTADRDFSRFPELPASNPLIA
jgi:predicted nucleic acid-binding protein